MSSHLVGEMAIEIAQDIEHKNDLSHQSKIYAKSKPLICAYLVAINHAFKNMWLKSEGFIDRVK